MIEQEHSTVVKARLVLIMVLFVLMGCMFLRPMSTPEKIKFEQISSEQGLSQNSVFTICQDKKGFLWLGTEEGLNRFDGYDFKVYRHKTGDPHSLIDNKVLVIYEDHAGELWIGTQDGLERFDHELEEFIHYKTPGSAATGNSLSSRIKAIYEDKSGVLWVGGPGGWLNRLDPQRKRLENYKNISVQPGNPNENSIRSIYEDQSGALWIGADKGGLNKLDKEKKTFSHYEHDHNNARSLSNNSVKTIFEDSRGIMWIGTEDGLNRLDRPTGTFIHYKNNPENPWSLSHNYVLSIFEDDTGVLWIGTYGGGVNRFDREKEIFQCNHYSSDVPGSLSDNNVYAIYMDRSGILWFGTNRGLNKYDQEKLKFPCWNAERDNSTLVNNNCVWSIYKDRTGITWFGTDSGLAQLDLTTGKMKMWTHDLENPDSLSHNKVLCIYEDHEDNHEDNRGLLWLGTEGGGLNCFDREKKKFSCYKNNPADNTSLSQDDVYAISEDRFGKLWIGTEQGLNRMDRKQNRFTHWKNDPGNPNSLSHNLVTFIFEDRSGILWIGTRGGLDRFNRSNESFTSWKNDPGNPMSLSDNQINYIYEDKAGSLWVATALGLNKFDRSKNTFISYTTRDGLPNDKINGILEDETGYLWLSTNYGISRFNTRTGEFRNYDIHDGLQSNEFNGNSCYRAPDGEMFFGGVNGFNYFYAGRIRDKLHSPAIVITDFQLFNESVNIDPLRKTLLKKSITETQEIILSFNDYFFAFEFAALDFTTPRKNKYEYKMEGFDETWIKKSADSRYASYMNLEPGSYTFRVRGSNNDGIWNQEGVSIKIHIPLPYWKTWWFLSFLGLFSCFSVFGFFQYRTRRLRQKLAEQQKVQETLRIARDLAEFRRAEIEKLVASISSLLIAVDSDGKIFQWNETAVKFFGIAEDKCMDRYFTDVLGKYIQPEKLSEITEKGLAGVEGKSFNGFDISIDLKEKGIRLLLAIINPIMDSGGKKLGFLLLAEDITHRKEEERRRNLSQKLESLGQMAGNIAHEIKTPLQYIGHNSQFVSDSFKDITKFYETVFACLPEIEQSDKRETAEKIRQIIDRCDIEYHLREIPKACNQVVEGVTTVSKIIHSMKEYSHPGRGVTEKADINKLLCSTIVIVQNKINKTLDIETEFCEKLPKISCYPGELNQVFMNLLGNALDAIQEKSSQEKSSQEKGSQEKGGEPGIIKITTALEDNEIIITITDNGCGIPDSIKENVFIPFFTTKEIGKGTGQGLSMAHNIVEKHKGKIYFKSRAGEGTSFYVHLPIQGEN